MRVVSSHLLHWVQSSSASPAHQTGYDAGMDSVHWALSVSNMASPLSQTDGIYIMWSITFSILEWNIICFGWNERDWVFGIFASFIPTLNPFEVERVWPPDFFSCVLGLSWVALYIVTWEANLSWCIWTRAWKQWEPRPSQLVRPLPPSFMAQTETSAICCASLTLILF